MIEDPAGQCSKSFGLVGLGVMGRNIALNLIDDGFTVSVSDPWRSAVAAFRRSPEADAVGLSVCENLPDLVAALSRPRLILIMVKAGEPVDEVIAQLTPSMDRGDVILDGGNSHYRDTQRREADLAQDGIHLMGLGISGGEEGARHGASLMAGGTEAAFELVRPALQSVAAAVGNVKCCDRFGPDGAGHFVKMIHNGIEYALMQLIAEAYDLLIRRAGFDHLQTAELFRNWNRTELASYLIEITAEVLTRNDELGKGPLVEAILDTAGQKGTGRWSTEEALSLGVPAPTIAEAVFARSMAALKVERVTAASRLPGPDPATLADDASDQQRVAEVVRQGLLGGYLTAYAQGLAVIRSASETFNWGTDLAAVARVWRAGCIIRARLLDRIEVAFQAQPAPPNLLQAPVMADLLADCQNGWREAVAMAALAGVPVPAFSSSLSYYDAYRSARLPANLIQAQRDYFGAHGYERLDQPGTFHIPPT